MKRNTLMGRRIMLAIVITLTMIGSLGSAGWSQDFSKTGRSKKTTSTTSRGGCPHTPKPLTALLPTTTGGGWTVKAHPTLWVYIPYSLTSDATIEFVLRDDQNREVYQTKRSGDGIVPGIIGLPLPSDKMAPLEIGKTYTWDFMVSCDKVIDRPAFVSGEVKRVAPDASLKQLTKSPQERSTLYANNLLWYDALTIVGEALRQKPGNKLLVDRWKSLLQLPSVGLDAIATESITPCCTITSKVGE
ncbi:MAG: DUF928 domain-containing protein [Leptolyngbyaceae cyanobacterium bins.302]|nr:DUF928 domain-containing protein [Leptolyngbyaceae cyanobacterium bins.302]